MLNDFEQKVIVLAGGNDQIPLILELRKRFGRVFIILIDYLEDPPAKDFVDKHITESTLNMGKVLEIATKEDIDLIITACTDQALLTMAYVSEKLHLKCYLTYQQALFITNKAYMKKVMLENDIPTSDFRIINETNSFDLGEMKLPFVIKPVDGNSSKGVKKITTRHQIKEAIKEAYQISRTNEVIIEEYFDGEEYSIDAFLLNGEPYIIISTKYNKINGNIGKFTILQSSYPAEFLNETKELIRETIKKIGHSFNLDNVPLFIQVLVSKDKVSVVEFSARTGGGSKQHFIKELTGVNIIENLLDITFNKKPAIHEIEPDLHASIVYIYSKPGIFSGLTYADELKKQKIIHDFFCYKSIGMIINKAEISSDRVAGYFVIDSTSEKLKEKIRYVDSCLAVLNEKGEDIMLHGLV